MMKGSGRGKLSSLPLLVFLVLGADYVDVAFSADGLLGGMLVVIFFRLLRRDGTSGQGWRANGF